MDTDFCHVQPASMNGCIVDLKPIPNALGFFWRECSVERAWNMCIQIIHNQDDFLCLRCKIIYQILDLVRPINSSSGQLDILVNSDVAFKYANDEDVIKRLCGLK